jgi:hypothetical protein
MAAAAEAKLLSRDMSADGTKEEEEVESVSVSAEVVEDTLSARCACERGCSDE